MFYLCNNHVQPSRGRHPGDRLSGGQNPSFDNVLVSIRTRWILVGYIALGFNMYKMDYCRIYRLVFAFEGSSNLNIATPTLNTPCTKSERKQYSFSKQMPSSVY